MARRVGRAFVGIVLAAVVLGAATARPAARSGPRVTFFGDSVADVLDYTPDAKQYLGQGLDARWELKVCRRLVQLSCPYQGVRPPTVLDVVKAAAKGELGPIVVVDVGYNDYVAQYRDDMDTVVRALLDKGVQHVIWTTIHEVRDDYKNMNVAIRAEAAIWPQVVIADFNKASQGQAWFNDDNIHLNSAGAWGLAKLLRPLILAACGDPCQPPTAPAGTHPSFVIRASTSWIRVGTFIAWRPPQRGTYAQATGAFGQAATCRLLPGRKSRVFWSSLGLTMQFIGATGRVCTGPAGMLVQTVTATGPRWKTSNGLRIGDPVTRLEELYPDAVAHPASYWLVKSDRATNHALFSAVIRRARVAAFQLAVRVGP